MTRGAVLLICGVLALANGCKCSRDSHTGAAPSASVRRPLAPLSAPSWLVPLGVSGFGDASVAVPVGAVEPRPVVIALHGGADRPEWQCSVWRGIAGPKPFVLCPRGVPRGGRFGWGTPEQTTRELRSALVALKKKYGDHVAPGPVTLAGYGPGATHAVSVAKQEPSFFARVVLVNGGTEAWTATNAAVFAHGRGKRVLFVCGLASCRADAERAVLFARHAGVTAKALTLETGAAFDAPLVSAVRKQWPWISSDAAVP